MKTVGMTQLREVIQRLTENGKKNITNAMLYETLGLEDEAAKARMRRRITDMVQRSELERIEQGVFKYNPKAQPQRNSEMYERIWRLVRAKEPGWSYQDMAARTRASYTMVNRYCNWLLEEGYIARHGRDGNTRLYRQTAKAKENRQTPYPPVAPTDPFEKERSASCRLVRLMMERDPYQAGVRKKIEKECRTILARFEIKEK
jgi:hypothetical protein